MFFARYYKFYRYDKTITEEDAKYDIPEGYSLKELDPDKDYDRFRDAWIKIYADILPEPHVKFQKSVLMKYPKTFILEDSSGNIIGFVVCYIKEDGKTGKILRIGLLKIYRKRGLGLLLYKKACEYFLQNNIKNIYFDIYEQDETLKRLAERAGFKQTKEFFITIENPVENFITLETIMSL